MSILGPRAGTTASVQPTPEQPEQPANKADGWLLAAELLRDAIASPSSPAEHHVLTVVVPFLRRKAQLCTAPGGQK